MDEKLQEFIEAKEQEAANKEMAEKVAFLRKLGLVDDSRKVRVYVKGYINGALYDKEKEAYYIDQPAPIEMTDEEYAMVRSLHEKTQPEVTCVDKKVIAQDSHDQASIDFNDENMLNTIANIVLVIALISSVILIFAALLTRHGFADADEIDWIAIAIAVGTSLSSTVIWATLSVISNISRSGKQQVLLTARLAKNLKI